MTHGSYLEQIARRAVQNTPGLLPPRGLARALRATPLEEPVSAERRPLTESSGLPPADPVPPSASVSIAPETPPERAASARSEASPTLSRASVVPEGIPGGAPPSRDPASQTRPADRAQQPLENEGLAAAAPPPAASPRSIGPRQPAARQRNIAVAPDPLAVALAAAARWTSSDDARPDAIAAARVERERGVGRDEPAFVAPREIRGRDTAAPPAPPDDAPPPVRRASRSEVVAATPDHRSAPAPAAERFAGVHIGSVEVQILAPPPVPLPVARRPAVSSGVPATPLTRGLTSAIGLRQS
jgi:hypothetical protein